MLDLTSPTTLAASATATPSPSEVIDPVDLEGDVTEKGKVWHRGGDEFYRTISTVAIHDGILYASDLSGFLYALDANTGEHFWTYDLLAAVWGSPYVADGRVFADRIRIYRAVATRQPALREPTISGVEALFELAGGVAALRSSPRRAARSRRRRGRCVL